MAGPAQELQGTVGQMPLLDFMQLLQIEHFLSDYLVVNDIWHFYHGLIILLLLYIFFLITQGKVYGCGNVTVAISVCFPSDFCRLVPLICLC